MTPTTIQESRFISVLRSIRTALYWAIEPLDALARNVNRLDHYPPIPLRRHVGPLGSMDGVGMEFVAYLKLLLKLKTTDRILDLGCGCGLLELALEAQGWRGVLVGVDIHRPCIRWAQRRISSRVPSFRFLHADIYNAAYWAKGVMSALEWFQQFPDTEFDVVLAKSLFTHMLPDEMEVYLGQLARRIRPGGRALLTYFLLNEAQRELERKGGNQILFHDLPGENACRVRRLVAPTAAVAYREDYLLDALSRHGLRLYGQISFGTWSGRRDGLSFQDIVVVTK